MIWRRLFVLVLLMAPIMFFCTCDDEEFEESIPNFAGVWNMTFLTAGDSLCDGSAVASGVPGPARGVIPDIRPGGVWLSTRLSQNAAALSGTFAEQQVLSLYLGTVVQPGSTSSLIAPGDSVTITYGRGISADGANGDIFRVLVVNRNRLTDVEFIESPSSLSSNTTVSFTFTALSPEIRVDFIGGLSSLAESIALDRIAVWTSSGGTVLNEGFEAGPAVDCGPSGANADRLELRRPGWSIGSLCVSTSGALAGTYSLRWSGGSYHNINGSILIETSMSGIPGMDGGLGGGFGGGDVGGIPSGEVLSPWELLGLLSAGQAFTASNIFMETWEPTWTHYFTSMLMVGQGQDNLNGTFRGESENHSCIESGNVAGSRHSGTIADLESQLWVMRISGEANGCSPALVSGNTITFGDTLTTATGDTISVIQIGESFASEEVLSTAYANYNMSGVAGGQLVSFVINETGNAATAAGIGFIFGDVLQGNLDGELVFTGGRVCALAEASFEVTFVSLPGP